jgi:hypothetical protein
VKKAGAFTFQLTREGIEARLGEMEKKMDRLRSMYESYFVGMERIPPDTARREMNRMMLEMQQVSIVASALRFRFQSLSQKWVLQSTYWNRTMREIEAGTFRRDVARTQRHLAERGGVISEAEALALGIPKNRVKAFVARHRSGAKKKSSGEGVIAPEAAAPSEPQLSAPAAPRAVSPSAAATPAPPTASAKPPAMPPPLPPRTSPPPIPAFARRSPSPDSASAAPPLAGVADRDFEGAFQRYLQAHRELGIEAQAIPKETLRQRLGKQLPKILQEKGCDRLRLEVAVEGGKVRLRAWPAENKA